MKNLDAFSKLVLLWMLLVAFSASVPVSGSNAKIMEVSKAISITVEPVNNQTDMEGLRFTVRLTNKSDQTVTLNVADRNRLFNLDIRDLRGYDLADMQVNFASTDLNSKGKTLLCAPHESKIYPVAFDSYKDVDGTIKKLPIGEYSVSAKLGVALWIPEPKEESIILPDGRKIAYRTEGTWDSTLLKSQKVKMKVGKELTTLLPENAEIRILPRLIVWQKNEINNSKTLRLEIKSPQLLEILSAKTSVDGFTVELKTIEAQKIYEIVVTPKSTERQTSGVVEVKTNFNLGGALNIPIGVVEATTAP